MTVKPVPPGGLQKPVSPDPVDDLPAGVQPHERVSATQAAPASSSPSATDAAAEPDPITSITSITSAAGAETVAHADPVAQIIEALAAQEIAPEQAVESIIEHTIATGPARALSSAERSALGAHIRELLAADPVLMGLTARLGYRARPNEGSTE